MSDLIALGAPEIEECLRGSIPMAIATCSAKGVTNVTYVSRVHRVGNDRIALSNQFLGKTKRNLAENPRASLLAISPATYAQYRIDVVFEQSQKSGAIFEELRRDIDALAALGGATQGFRLLSADIFRINQVTRVFAAQVDTAAGGSRPELAAGYVEMLGEIASLAGRTSVLDQLVEGVRREFTPVHPGSLITLFRRDGIELEIVEPRDSSTPELEGIRGALNLVATRNEPLRLDNLVLSSRYGTVLAGENPTSVRDRTTRSEVKSLAAAPVTRDGEVRGVIAWTSTEVGRFGAADLAALRVVASFVVPYLAAESSAPASQGVEQSPGGGSLFSIMADDASVFLDYDYIIRGLGGEILSYLLETYTETGRTEFSNRELRSAPSLEIPGLKENLESRLLELQRRLEEKSSPVTIVKTARGRFRLEVSSDFSIDRPHTAARVF